MGSLLHCFCRHCCNRCGCDRDDDDDDDQVHHHEQRRVRPPLSARIPRHSYQIAPAGSNDEDDQGDDNSRLETAGGGVARGAAAGGSTASVQDSRDRLDNTCCQPTRTRTPADQQHGERGSGGSAAAAPATSLPDFFRRLRERWNSYGGGGGGGEAATAASSSHETASLNNSNNNAAAPTDDYHMRHLRLSRENSGSAGTTTPLKAASSFGASREMMIPSIDPNTIILPGSDLQRKMAELMLSSPDCSSTARQVEDECVICMEGFTPDNPRMPTLCGCGENKTYFHLPCLYQWIEQDRNCPSCRKKLRWEEF